jgi:hypothetical protein
MILFDSPMSAMLEAFPGAQWAALIFSGIDAWERSSRGPPGRSAQREGR